MPKFLGMIKSGVGGPGGPHKIPKFRDQKQYPSAYHVSYGYGLPVSGFVDGGVIHIGQALNGKEKIFIGGSLTPREPKTWKPILACLPFWKNSCPVPGCKSKNRVSANHRGNVYILGSFKIWGLGASPNFWEIFKHGPK